MGGKYLSNVYELGIFGEGVTDIEGVEDYASECDRNTSYEYYQEGLRDVRMSQYENNSHTQIFYRFFDEQGNIVKSQTASIDSNGTEQSSSYINYEYDENNNLIEKQEDGEDTVHYSYDDNGNLIQKMTTYSSSQTSLVYYDIKTDENNNVAEKVEYRDGEETYTYRYEYEGNNVISESIYRPDGTEDEKTEYEYNNGNLIAYKHYAFHSKEYYPEDSFELEDERHFKYDENGFLTSYSIYTLGTEMIVDILYDEYHNIQQIEKSNENGKKVYYVFEYTDGPSLYVAVDG